MAFDILIVGAFTLLIIVILCMKFYYDKREEELISKKQNEIDAAYRKGYVDGRKIIIDDKKTRASLELIRKGIRKSFDMINSLQSCLIFNERDEIERLADDIHCELYSVQLEMNYYLIDSIIEKRKFKEMEQK